MFSLKGKTKEKQSEDIITYLENYLQIEFRDMVQAAEGEIIVTCKEEYAYLKAQIISGYEQDIMGILVEKYGASQEPENFVIPGYEGHIYAKELRKGSISAVFFDMRSAGKKKTRAVELYLVEYDGATYLYFMG